MAPGAGSYCGGRGLVVRCWAVAGSKVRFWSASGPLLVRLEGER